MTQKRHTVQAVKKLPPFVETQKLRDVFAAADVYRRATGDSTMVDALRVAVEFAEGVEEKKSFSQCLVCKTRVPKERKYCGFDCAEEDSAIEK